MYWLHGYNLKYPISERTSLGCLQSRRSIITNESDRTVITWGCALRKGSQALASLSSHPWVTSMCFASMSRSIILRAYGTPLYQEAPNFSWWDLIVSWFHRHVTATWPILTGRNSQASPGKSPDSLCPKTTDKTHAFRHHSSLTKMLALAKGHYHAPEHYQPISIHSIQLRLSHAVPSM